MNSVILRVALPVVLDMLVTEVAVLVLFGMIVFHQAAEMFLPCFLLIFLCGSVPGIFARS